MRVSCAIIALLIALALASQTISSKSQFEDFIRTHKRHYSTQSEYARRFSIFQQNLERAEKLNIQNGGSAVFGITKFSDLTPEEFTFLYLSKSSQIQKPEGSMKTKFDNKKSNSLNCQPTEENFDWTSCGAVSPVKDQGKCNCGWAMAAVENLESSYAINTGALTALSVEQVVDCNSKVGCVGGNLTNAIQYLQSIDGLVSDAAYPFIAGGGVGDSCKLFAATSAVLTTSRYQTSGATTHKPTTTSSTTTNKPTTTTTSHSTSSTSHKPTSTSSSSHSTSSSSNSGSSGNSASGKTSSSGKSTSTSTGSSTGTSTGSTGTSTASTGTSTGPTGSTGTSTGPTGSTAAPTGSTSAPTGSSTDSSTAQPTGSTASPTGSSTDSSTSGPISSTSGDSDSSTGSFESDFVFEQRSVVSSTPITTIESFSLLAGETGIYSQLSSKSGSPVVVAVDASSWALYKSGVITSCGSTPNHYALVVGYMSYGQEGAHWVVRNSWGSSWGEEGNIYLAIGTDMCGISQYPVVLEAKH